MAEDGRRREAASWAPGRAPIQGVSPESLSSSGSPASNVWSLGPRSVLIQRASNGDFGFTLRHFIVYPPESYTVLARDNRLGLRQITLDEPMDTIFVKHVRENGPAHVAGLATGDRIVSVNDETIGGKTYAQVVQLIQNSGVYLRLLVVPKENDILQQYYGDTAHNPETNQRPQRMRSPEVRNNSPGDIAALKSKHPYHRQQPTLTPRPTSVSNIWVSHPPSETTLYGSMAPAPLQELDQRRQINAHARSEFMSSTLPDTRRDVTPWKTSSDKTLGVNVRDPLRFKSWDRSKYPANAGCRLSLDGGLLEVSPSRRESSSSSSLPTTNTIRDGSKDSLLSMDSSSTLQDGCSSEDSLILSRIRKSTEQKEEFLRRPAQCIWPAPEATQETPIAREFYARPQKLQKPAWPPACASPPPMGGPASNLVPGTEAERSHAESTRRKDSDSEGDGDGSSATSRSKASFFSTLSRIQENQAAVSSVASDDTMINGDSMSTCSSRGDDSSHPHLPVSHLVSLRARQFLDEEASDRTALYRSELARLSSRKGVPEVAVRKREFESRSQQEKKPEKCTSPTPQTAPLSGNRTTPVGSKHIHCEPPDDYQGDTEDLTDTSESKPQTRTRVRSHSADPTRHDHRHKAMRQDSYLAACSKDRCFALRRQGVTSAVLEEEMDAPSSWSSTVPTISVCSPSPPVRPNVLPILDPIRPAASSRPRMPLIDENRQANVQSVDTTSVKRRPKDMSVQADEERSTRRVSYLKATWKDRMHMDSDLELSDNESGSGSHRSLTSQRHHSLPEADISNNEISQPIREGWLHSKVTQIDGKRAGDRSWKQVWAVLRGPVLCLYKDRAHSQLTETPLGSTDSEHVVASSTGSSVDLRCSVVEVAADYTKKKHVLRINSSSGSELLLQAEHGSDLTEWVRALQEQSGEPDDGSAPSRSGGSGGTPQGLSPTVAQKGIKKLTSLRNRSPTGQSPINKTRKPSQAAVDPLPSPKTKTWKIRVAKQFRKMHQGGSCSPSSPTAPHPEGCTIGVPLEECPQSSFSEAVPLLLELCTKIVEARGLELIGIYRVPGNTAAVTSLTESINKGIDINTLQDPRWNDVNVVSSLLKSFFRRLPDSLFTTELYPHFIDADKIEDPAKRVHAIRKLIHELPEHHYETLKFLLIHLKRVVDNSEFNKMEARNLAIVFGPTLVRAGDDNMVTMVTDMSSQCRIVETLITHVDWFFSDDEAEEFPFNFSEDASVASSETSAAASSVTSNATSQNQSLLLGNIHKVEGMKADSPSKDVSAKDIVSSIITAANRKIQRGKSRKSAVPEETFAPDAGTEHAGPKQIAEPQQAKSKDESVSPSPVKESVLDNQQRHSSALESVHFAKKNFGGSPISPSIAVQEPETMDITSSSSEAPRNRTSLVCPNVSNDEVAIRSYANLAASTQERIRRFEEETKAMLERDLHSHHREAERRDAERQRVEKQWLQAKRDLEAEEAIEKLSDAARNVDRIMAGARLGAPPTSPATTDKSEKRSSWRVTWGSRLSSSSSTSGASTSPVSQRHGQATAPQDPRVRRSESAESIGGGGGGGVERSATVAVVPHDTRSNGHLKRIKTGRETAGGDRDIARSGSLDSLAERSVLDEGGDLVSSLTSTFDQKLKSIHSSRKSSPKGSNSVSTSTAPPPAASPATTTSTPENKEVEEKVRPLRLLACGDDIPFADTDTTELDSPVPLSLVSHASEGNLCPSTSPTTPLSYRDPSLHRAARPLSSAPRLNSPATNTVPSCTVAANDVFPGKATNAADEKESFREKNDTVSKAELNDNAKEPGTADVPKRSVVRWSSSDSKQGDTKVDTDPSADPAPGVTAPTIITQTTDVDADATENIPPVEKNRQNKANRFDSSTKLKRSESLNKSDRPEVVLSSKLRRSESLNKNDRSESIAPIRLRRSESLSKAEKRSDSLTKSEKLESKTEWRRRQQEVRNVRSNGGDATKLLIQNATNVLTKLKRKNGMPERSIKRRHTVGGTKDFDKLHWLDNRLQNAYTGWQSNSVVQPGDVEKKSLRTSSPDLSSSRMTNILVEVSLRPHSLPDPNLVSFKVPLESRV